MDHEFSYSRDSDGRLPKKLFIDTGMDRTQSPLSAPIRRKRESWNAYGDSAGPAFKPTQQLVALLNRGHYVQTHLLPKMDKGFFLSQVDWTCYRRNYFQISASFSLAVALP
jgi:hypothetical protein